MFSGWDLVLYLWHLFLFLLIAFSHSAEIWPWRFQNCGTSNPLCDLYFCICVYCIVFVFCSLYGCYSSGTGLPLMWVSHMSPNSALLSVTRFSIYRKVWKSGKSHQRSPTDPQHLCQRRTVMMRQWKFQAGRVLARPSQFCTLLCSNASAPVYLCCNSLLSLLFVHHLHGIELADIPIASEK